MMVNSALKAGCADACEFVYLCVVTKEKLSEWNEFPI